MKKKYILGVSAISYILESFPRKLMEAVWHKFEEHCNNGLVITDRETKKALERELTENESMKWISKHPEMFKPITQKEAERLGELVQSGTFDYYINSPAIIRKLPEATPFIMTMAIEQNRILVMHKTCKDKKKIEQICKDNSITFIEVEEYLMDAKASS